MSSINSPKIYKFSFSRYDGLYDVFFVYAHNIIEAEHILFNKNQNLKFAGEYKAEVISELNNSEIIDEIYGVMNKNE